MKKWGVFCFLLFVCVSCQSQPPGIASLIDTDLERVEEVRVTHNNETIVLLEEDAQSLLQALESAAPRGRADWFPYTEEDYTVKLVAGGDEHAVTLHWFAGKHYYVEPSITGNGEVLLSDPLDTRVDMEVGGQIYSFDQPKDNIWNAEKLRTAYERAARFQGITLTPDYVFDGYEDTHQHSSSAYTVPLGLDWQGKSLEEIWEAADLVVIAQSQGAVFEAQKYEQFAVREVLKGSTASEVLYVYQHYGPRENGGVCYPPAEDPLYEPGPSYLLALTQETDGHYSPVAGIFSTAIVADNMCYPRYNTEHHPFFQVSAESLRARG